MKLDLYGLGTVRLLPVTCELIRMSHSAVDLQTSVKDTEALSCTDSQAWLYCLAGLG